MTEINNKSEKAFSLLNWLGWFFALNLAWLLLAALAVWLGWRSYTLSTTGSVAEGTVVKLLEDDAAFDADFTPIIEFEVDGQTYSVQSQNTYRWWNRYLRFPVGGQVQMRYNPANPETAEVNSWWDLWNETIILAVFAALCAIGVNIYLLMRWRSQRNMQASAGIHS